MAGKRAMLTRQRAHPRWESFENRCPFKKPSTLSQVRLPLRVHQRPQPRGRHQHSVLAGAGAVSGVPLLRRRREAEGVPGDHAA